MDLGKPHIRLQLKDAVVRGMNRQQYKATSHYIGSICRLIDAGINWEAFYKHISDAMVCGYSAISLDDLLR